MLSEKQFPFLAEKGHMVSLVGGGGKTTLLYAFARHCAAKGWRVLVSTTTHIRQPGENYAADEAALASLWAAGQYAVAGVPAEQGKLIALPPEQLTCWMAQADMVLLEADGAKRLMSTEEEIKEYLAGNLCRCSGYEGQLRGIQNFLAWKKAKQEGAE